MGRGKLMLSFIENEKQRKISFRQRLESLKKKALELSTLCDVPMCVIIFPHSFSTGVTADIWPPNPDMVRAIIDRYRSERLRVGGRKRKATEGLVESRSEKKMRSLEPNYLNWHPCLDKLDGDRLGILASDLESKLELVHRRIASMKERSSYPSLPPLLAPGSPVSILDPVEEGSNYSVSFGFECGAQNCDPLVDNQCPNDSNLSSDGDSSSDDWMWSLLSMIDMTEEAKDPPWFDEGIGDEVDAATASNTESQGASRVLQFGEFGTTGMSPDDEFDAYASALPSICDYDGFEYVDDDVLISMVKPICFDEGGEAGVFGLMHDVDEAATVPNGEFTLWDPILSDEKMWSVLDESQGFMFNP